MSAIGSFYFRCTCAVSTLVGMSNERERVISIALTETEWQAFIARHPQPVTWLRERIREQVDVTAPAERQVA